MTLGTSFKHPSSTRWPFVKERDRDGIGDLVYFQGRDSLKASFRYDVGNLEIISFGPCLTWTCLYCIGIHGFGLLLGSM